ncbi:GTPase IMAP family member 4-like [Trichomycterus rosablanca]|uniref:GTPase IMAP family member 4-like n=1 Tax=Trichomycterus rosablanca TaxID=2290929 RepID=UPI002F35CD5E
MAAVVSELRIILLGKSHSETSSVGNLILGRAAFETEVPPHSVDQHSERARGLMEERHITIINAPHLYNPELTQSSQRLKECVSLTAPGPHAFLLVVQPQSFTEEDTNQLKVILSCFSDRALNYSILISTGWEAEEEKSASFNKFLVECDGRFHKFKFLHKFDKTLVWWLFEDIDKLLKVNGITTFCQKETCEFNGRLITVIDTPGLFDTKVSNIEIKKEIIKCISMAAPGPHVFLLVLKIGQCFTQEERDAVNMIKETFGEKSRMYTMVLFSSGDQLKKQTIAQYIQKGSDIKKLLYEFGNRYHVFNNNDRSSNTQVCVLLDKIDSIVRVNKGSCYTNEMFQQVEKTIKENQERILKEKEEHIEREKEELKAKYEAEMGNMKKIMQEQKEQQEAESRKKKRKKRLKYEQERKKKDKQHRQEMENKLREQQEEFRKEKENEERVRTEVEQRNLAFVKEQHAKELENLKKQTEQETRKQAEEEFNAKLEEKVKEAKYSDV